MQGKKFISAAFIALVSMAYGSVLFASQPKEQPSSQQQSNGNELTPQQQEQLEIDEDNVMNPFPG